MTTWLQRIAKAKQTGYFTRDDKICAQEWPTCSVGEAVARHHKAFRYETAGQLASSAHTLDHEGKRFTLLIRDDHPYQAEALHRSIAQHVKRIAASRVTARTRRKML